MWVRNANEYYALCCVSQISTFTLPNTVCAPCTMLLFPPVFRADSGTKGCLLIMIMGELKLFKL